MRKIRKGPRLLRPSDALLPLAMVIVSVLGRSDAAEAVYMNRLFPALFALGSSRGVRLAFAEQPSMRRAAGSVRLALALQFVGAFAFFVVDLIKNQGRFAASNAIYIAIGMLLNIEHVFYEYLFATGDARSAAMTRAITSAVMAGGLMMSTEASGAGVLPHTLEWALGGAALSALVAAIIGLSVGGRLKGRVNNAILKCAPLAMAQTAIYPLSWLIAVTLLRKIMFQSLTAAPFFLGLMVYDLCRTPFRRTGAESRRMNPALMIVALVGALLALTGYVPPAQYMLSNIAGRWAHELPAAGVMLVAAAGCAFGMYGKIALGAEE